MTDEQVERIVRALEELAARFRDPVSPVYPLYKVEPSSTVPPLATPVRFPRQ
jgi:hypothetical protein